MKKIKGRPERKVGETFVLHGYRLKKTDNFWKIVSGNKKIDYVIDENSIIDNNNRRFDAQILDIKRENNKKIFTVKLSPHNCSFQEKSSFSHECIFCKKTENHQFGNSIYIPYDNNHHRKIEKCTVCGAEKVEIEKHIPNETKIKCRCGFAPDFVKDINKIKNGEMKLKNYLEKNNLSQKELLNKILNFSFYLSLSMILEEPEKYLSYKEYPFFVLNGLMQYTKFLANSYENILKNNDVLKVCLKVSNNCNRAIANYSQIFIKMDKILNELETFFDNFDKSDLKTFLTFNASILDTDKSYTEMVGHLKKIYNLPEIFPHFDKLRVNANHRTTFISLITLFYKAYIEDGLEEKQVYSKSKNI